MLVGMIYLIVWEILEWPIILAISRSGTPRRERFVAKDCLAVWELMNLHFSPLLDSPAL